MGTIVNVIVVIIGGILGLFLGDFVGEKAQHSITKAAGLSTLFIAISGCLDAINGDNALLVLILSMVFGTLVGEWIDIEGGFEAFGAWLQKKTGSQKDGGFVNAFVTTSFTVCIGAMAIVGSLQDGLSGDSSILYAKSLLDFFMVFVFASTLGKGAIFSFIPIALLQGSITLLAQFISPFVTQRLLDYLSMTGSVMIFAVGINLIWPKTFRVANQLPGLLFAVFFSFFFFN